MTVTAVRKDPDALTMTLTAEFDASPARVWDLWADPRQLERWWGPPTWPATFTAHDLAPGSHVEYHMTGPTGDEAHGFWDIVEADPPRRLVFLDGFANDDGTPNDDFPRNEGRVTIEPIGARTHPDVDREPLPEHRGDGAGPGHGHGGGPHPGGRPDRRDPRRGSRSVGLDQARARPHEETHHDHDDPADDAHPGRARRRPDLRRPNGGGRVRAGAADDRIADGRERVRHARRALHRSHRGHLRPAGRRTQHQGRSGRAVHARGARRRPASDHRRARRGPGRPLRQQRWRGERARPRGEAPGAGPDARRARAAARVDPARPRGRAGGLPGDPRDVRAERVRRRHGAVHRRRGPSGSDRRRLRRPARAGSGDVRAAHRRRRHPDRPPAGPEHRLVHALRARRRGAAWRLHPDRARRWRRVGRPVGLSRCVRGGRRARDDARDVPERPRWLPR